MMTEKTSTSILENSTQSRKVPTCVAEIKLPLKAILYPKIE